MLINESERLVFFAFSLYQRDRVSSSSLMQCCFKIGWNPNVLYTFSVCVEHIKLGKIDEVMKIFEKRITQRLIKTNNLA